jgi:anti-sigma factor RsiW
MCDTELLIDYLYGELAADQRQKFDLHLKSCADCRREIDGIRATRTTLQSWAPPEPDLTFEVVRAPQRGEAFASQRGGAKSWKLSPAWGLAAAAMLVGAISVAIANVEVTYGDGQLTFRTGWNQAPVAQAQDTATEEDPAALRRELAAVSERLTRAESLLADQTKTTNVSANAVAGRMTDAEIARFVRHMINESEERQQSVLARQILQINRDVETARRTDFDRLGRGMVEIQRTAVETFQRQKALEDHLLRVGLQR